MKQFKLFKYIRNYFVRLPFRNFYPIYIPLVYVSCAVVTAITVLTNPEMSACTLGQRLIITAVWVLFSPIFAPIALWTYNTLWILTDPFKEAVSEFLHAVKGDKFIESPGEEEFLCTLDLFTSRNLTMEQGKELWYKKHNIKVVEVTEEVDEQTGETSLLPEPKQVYISEEQVADAELLKKREMDMLYQGVLLYNRSLLKYYLNEEQITKFVNNLFDLRESKEPEERIPTLTVVSAEDKICNIATPRKRLSMYEFYTLVANLRPITMGEGVTNTTLYHAYRQMFPGLLTNTKDKSFAQALSKCERYDSENHVIPNEVIPRLDQRTQKSAIEYFISLAQSKLS